MSEKTDLEMLLNKLWDADENMCVPGKDYLLNLQGRLSKFSNGIDNANKKLFNTFDSNRIFARPTYKLFRKLLDNYEMQTGIPDFITTEENSEHEEFLNAILDTKVMKILHKFLIDRHLVSPNHNHFKKELKKIWFEMYKRSNVPDSCGFEHVFVGELKNGQIIGLHNWIQLYLQEQAGNIDYKGYFELGTSGESDNPRIITIQFTWKDGQSKPKGSSFVGTSPEFEMAFYTALFYCNVDSSDRFKVANYNLSLFCYKMHGKISTSYIKCWD